MDVGLNNKNTLGELAPEFSDVVFFIKATDNEQFTLWQEWSKESRHNIEPLSDAVIERIVDRVYHPYLCSEITELNDKIKKITQPRVNWQQIMAGFNLTIGHIEEYPVCVSFSFALINGKKVCFYHSTSRMVDHEMIEDWLMGRFQLTHDKYTRRNHVDATNFHNCVNSLDNLDKEPRDTVYKKH